ncbi:YfhJ family protein [Bacillus massilinigeriensis]|uniref:YfhJ family protein n=1 Tax=Bacillus massilionigeriensis TaxID=1805475 RepID=UPI00096B58F2|nr:YfhJ family protein [Bacillus massilionigeriensis]
MNEYQNRLIELLLEKNKTISINQAQTWVELLWDDFETTYAKAGREYMGSEMTERIVRQWINQYGDRLHEFTSNNPKYKHLLEQDPSKLN